MILRTAVAALLLALPAAAGAAPVPALAIDYARRLSEFRRAPSAGGMEALFAFGSAAGDSLVRDGELGRMDDSTFARTARQFEGWTLMRDEVEGLLPDMKFFTALAQAHGDAGDRAFFDAYAATGMDRIMPAYVEQQTDYSGCARFGSGSLVDAWARWSAFRSAYPRRYAATAREALDDATRALVEEDCACGARSSVERELGLYLERFPHGALADRVRARLRAVESGKAEIHEHCSSG